MLRNAFDVGTLFGIRVRLNWSVSVIFALIVFHLAAGVFPYWHPDWSGALLIGVALAAAFVFFISLLLHELAHALTAQMYGIPVGSITLFLFGGVADIQREPERPGMEALIAIVGPLTSAALGAAFLFAFSQLYPESAQQADVAFGMAKQMGPVATILAWVGPINILLAIFNMIPAFPLDGGRILRALLWWQTDELSRATRWAAIISRGIAFLFIGLGIAMALGFYIPILGGGPIAGLWIVFIGWFLASAARGTYTRVVITDSLKDVTVERLTDRNIIIVPPEMTIEDLVDEFASTRPQRIFPVADEEEFKGAVDISDVQRIPPDLWGDTRVTALMTPADELFTVSPDELADSALNEMTRRDLDELVVREDGEVIGLLHQDNILRWVRMHAERSPV